MGFSRAQRILIIHKRFGVTSLKTEKIKSERGRYTHMQRQSQHEDNLNLIVFLSIVIHRALMHLMTAEMTWTMLMRSVVSAACWSTLARFPLSLSLSCNHDQTNSPALALMKAYSPFNPNNPNNPFTKQRLVVIPFDTRSTLSLSLSHAIYICLYLYVHRETLPMCISP